MPNHFGAIVVGAAAIMLSGTAIVPKEIDSEPATAAAPAVLLPVAPAPQPTVEVEDAGLAKPIHVRTAAGMIYLPRGFHLKADKFDVVVHFHGAASAVEPELERAGVNAALITVNLGNGSGVYQRAYDDEGSLGRAVAAVTETVHQSTSRTAEVRHVALSAWSAGYGAVARVLARPQLAAKVDAVLLADGLHSPFVSLATHQLDDGRMAPFVAYARQAIAGERLMGITHSDIPTDGYASTTQTTNDLLRRVDVNRRPASATIAETMKLTSTADRGNLHVMGFQGASKEAHCEHVRDIGQTLFPLLQQRWSANAATTTAIAAR